MKLCSFSRDGGPESTVWGFWFIEIKSLFSIALLVFEDGSRDAFHSHAFNCFSWLISGMLREEHRSGDVEVHVPSLLPFLTRRSTFHKVTSLGRAYVLTFRGPWSDTWDEYIPSTNSNVVLTHGRKVVSNLEA